MSSRNTANEIQREMRQVRRDLDEQVDELVDQARQITEELVDWRSYVKAHPWLYLGAAAGLGYLIMPTRVTVDRPVADSLAELARSGAIKLEEPEAEKSLLDRAIDMGIAVASSTVLQVGMTWLNHQLTGMVASALAPKPPAGDSGSATRGPGSFH
jgi:hypothetical protein